MNNIFEQGRIYSEGWTLVEDREFNEKEKSTVDNAVVEEGDFGLSVKFHLVKGGHFYIPLAKDSKLGTGEVVDINKLHLITLATNGRSNIQRVMETNA